MSHHVADTGLTRHLPPHYAVKNPSASTLALCRVGGNLAGSTVNSGHLCIMWADSWFPGKQQDKLLSFQPLPWLTPSQCPM